MFTGLVEEVATVIALRTSGDGKQLQIESATLASKTHVGESIAVNGCCLTVAYQSASRLTFDVLRESLDRTNLKAVQPENRVNLERAVAAGAPLGGHFVQGHVDCAASIRALEQIGADHRLEIDLPSEFAHYVAFKGSIAVNGISLTVAEILPASFVVWIIPHTKAQTNLAWAEPGDLVNLEFDLLAKYVERILDRQAVRST